MIALTNTFWAGSLYLLAGGCGLIRHFLLEPGMPQYPRAPRWLLHVFFMFASVLIFVGLRFLSVWWSGAGATVPPGVSPIGMLLSIATFVYKASLLYNVLSQRYSADTWARMNRITEMVRCSRERP